MNWGCSCLWSSPCDSDDQPAFRITGVFDRALCNVCILILTKRLKFVFKTVGNSWWDKIQKGKEEYKAQSQRVWSREELREIWRLIEITGLKQFNTWMVKEIDRLDQNDTKWFTFQSLKMMGRTSLVAQWLRIRLPMQGTRVRTLVREDPTCCRATKSASHNYWSPCT